MMSYHCSKNRHNPLSLFFFACFIFQSVTRVPVEKITYVSHDPEDVCYFGIIIQTKESHTGFRLYCFKAEKPVVSLCIKYTLY